MTFGGLTGRRLLLLVAILATFVVLGCWDNRNGMEDVLARGYDTTAQVTGAQYQRKAPFAMDGWRPRFVEQDISVDLQWQGKDGKPHERRKVPVSEAFARTIVSGDQVRLAVLPVKVIDDEQSVPVVMADVSGRLGSLQAWISTSAYVALAAWAGFAALSLLFARTGGAAAGAARPVDIPLRRTLLGIAMLVGGALMAFHSWSDAQSFDALGAGGEEVTADILEVLDMPRKEGDRPSYAVRLAWKDRSGAVHHYGPTHISEGFWRQITKDGVLAVRQAAIRFRPDQPTARPLIVADAPEQHWQSRFGMGAGLVFVVIGLGCLFSAARAVSRQRP